MAGEKVPRILSPNLGCPQIVSPEALEKEGIDCVLAGGEQDFESQAYYVQAEPSYPDGGHEFSLSSDNPAELVDDELPQRFEDVSETRFLISSTLRSEVFVCQARFWRVKLRCAEDWRHAAHLREAQGAPRSTLYDLVLYRGKDAVHRVKHALCLRPSTPKVRFIHLTDLHVAARNDIWAEEVNSTVNPKPGDAPLQFKNFNNRLRDFIKYANTLADEGRLDFVLAMGDLIDFVNYGIGEPKPGQNNWRTLIDILTGGGDESERDNKGLRVPVFTTTGNHDWRPNPYPPEYNPDLFGLKKKELQKFDYLYADDSDVVGAKILEIHSKLISKGSPILAQSWWGRVAGWVIRASQVQWDKFWRDSPTRSDKELLSSFFKFLATLLGLAGVGGWVLNLNLEARLLSYLFPGGLTLDALKVGLEGLAVLAVSVFILAELLLLPAKKRIHALLREVITALIGIESDVGGLRDYFLNVNPYFNYAFRLENCYFLVLDTGHDALTAESFWDDGGKKIRHLKVKDNIIGGSPETVGFFAPDQYYPYSQITWLKSVLDCVQRAQKGQLAQAPRECRVFVGLHAPPANVSSKDRKRADGCARSDPSSPVLMKRGWPGGYDIHYGTANHYISEFFYLCLGYAQAKRDQLLGPGVDVVLGGHVHWNIDFRLDKPTGATRADWNPEVYYGNFSDQVEAAGLEGKGDHRWWGTLLLQTAACGPPSKTAGETPYFRVIEVDEKACIDALRPTNLKELQQSRSRTGPNAAPPPQT